MRLTFRYSTANQQPLRARSPSLLRELIDGLCGVVFPTACWLCGEELTGFAWVSICRTCWGSLEPWAGPICVRCGIPFSSERPLESSDSLCAECRRREHDFDLARSYGLYSGKLRAVILQLKFRRRERLGWRLGELLQPVWSSIAELVREVPVILLPVPLHRTRERERGFNQAELLAQGLAQGFTRRLGKVYKGQALRVETHCLRRLRPTVPQTGLDTRARQENVRGVFGVTSAERVRDRIVLLVDDVMTTGATASACAVALKRAGARQVAVLTLARVTPQFPDVVAAAPAAPSEAGTS